MKVVRTLEEFARYNHAELKALAHNASRRSREDVEDMVQEWYINAHRYRILERYDESKGKYETYCVNALFWNDHAAIRQHVDIGNAPDETGTIDELQVRLDSFKRFLVRKRCKKMAIILSEIRRRLADAPAPDLSPVRTYDYKLRQFLRAESQG